MHSSFNRQLLEPVDEIAIDLLGLFGRNLPLERSMSRFMSCWNRRQWHGLYSCVDPFVYSKLRLTIFGCSLRFFVLDMLWNSIVLHRLLLDIATLPQRRLHRRSILSRRILRLAKFPLQLDCFLDHYSFDVSRQLLPRLSSRLRHVQRQIRYLPYLSSLATRQISRIDLRSHLLVVSVLRHRFGNMQDLFFGLRDVLGRR